MSCNDTGVSCNDTGVSVTIMCHTVWSDVKECLSCQLLSFIYIVLSLFVKSYIMARQ